VDLKLGLFETFTYAVPGAAYIGLGLFCAERLNWLTWTDISGAGSLGGVVTAAVASFVVGTITSPIGAMLRKVPGFKVESRDVIDDFVRRNPSSAGRAFITADKHLLLAHLQLTNADVTAEVDRLRSVGLMCMNLVAPLGLAAVASLVMVFKGDNKAAAATFAVAAAVGIACARAEGLTLSRWAFTKTLELAFWSGAADERLTEPEPRSKI
jgi:hypothetical protein